MRRQHGTGFLGILLGVLVLLLVVALCGSLAWSQEQPVQTWPAPSSTIGGGNVSGTIGVTNTFQQLWPTATLSPGGVPLRRGCTVINQGTHTMYVTEGLTIATSTLTNSVQLGPTQAYYCGVGGLVLTGEIDITGTATDAFYAAQY